MVSAMNRKLNGIILRARAQAWKHVRAEVLKVLPKGWTLYFAVGWGLTLIDADRHTVFGTYENAPPRMPRGLRKACELAADFVEMFGEDNSTIEGRKT